MEQSLEIDFLAVNSGEKSGDAICLRYGDFSSAGTQNVIVIDGGTLESGRNMVKHIKDNYQTNMLI